MKRGEMYYANIDGGIGSEQGGRRPVIIIQNDKGNTYSTTTIVAMITASNKKQLPTHVSIVGCGLTKPSIILAEQIRTIGKERITDFIGVAPKCVMRMLDKALCISLSIRG
jgi:mRNA interferase MazF